MPFRAYDVIIARDEIDEVNGLRDKWAELSAFAAEVIISFIVIPILFCWRISVSYVIARFINNLQLITVSDSLGRYLRG